MRPSLNSLSSALSNDETLHDPLGSCRRRADVVARLNAGAARWTPPWRWALAQHRTPFSQPGRTRQRASRATLSGGTARAATLGIFTTAPPTQSHGHLRPGRWSPVSLRRDSRPSRGSAALALPTRGFSAGRGDHTPGRRCVRRRRCRGKEGRCPVFASRAASADRYDSTCYRVTRCETGHSCCRAAHLRTACVSCVVRLHTAEWESLRSKARLDRACPSPN